MQNELDVLRDVSRRLESAGIAYMLTGSMAMNYYAQPRMTRDIDLVLEVGLSGVARLPTTTFHPKRWRSPFRTDRCST